MPKASLGHSHSGGGRGRCQGWSEQEESKPLNMPQEGSDLRREAPMEAKATRGQVKYRVGVSLENLASAGPTAQWGQGFPV